MKTRKGGHEDKIGRTGFQWQGNAGKCKFIQAALNREDTAYAGMYGFQSS